MWGRVHWAVGGIMRSQTPPQWKIKYQLVLEHLISFSYWRAILTLYPLLFQILIELLHTYFIMKNSLRFDLKHYLCIWLLSIFLCDAIILYFCFQIKLLCFVFKKKKQHLCALIIKVFEIFNTNTIKRTLLVGYLFYILFGICIRERERI